MAKSWFHNGSPTACALSPFVERTEISGRRNTVCVEQVGQDLGRCQRIMKGVVWSIVGDAVAVTHIGEPMRPFPVGVE